MKENVEVPSARRDGPLLFSQRALVAKSVDDWICEKGIDVNTSNVIIALDSFGLINREKTRREYQLRG